MGKVLLLIAGGALGTLSRYIVASMANGYWGSNFPYGTLAVNLVGSFIIGFLWGILEKDDAISDNLRSFAFVGFLGGFTTFSSYSLETLNLMRNDDVKLGMINILANNILGLLLVFIGFTLARLIRH